MRQKDGESALMDSPPTRTSSGKPMGEGHDMSLLSGGHYPSISHALSRLLLNVFADEFGLSADIISGSLGPTSLVSDNAMFSSATAAPLPLHPIGLGFSDSPSMSAYITTGSPGSDTTNSQLIWKQSANLPDSDLLKHLYGVMFLTHTGVSEFTLLFQRRGVLRLSSPCKSTSAPAHVPFVSTFFLLVL